MIYEVNPVFIVWWNATDTNEHGRFQCESIQEVDRFLTELERRFTFTGYRHSVHQILPLNYVQPTG